MGYAWSGYTEMVVEIRWVPDQLGETGDQFGDFVRGVNDIMGAELLPSTQGGELLGAMVEGQSENVHWVRIQGPPLLVMLGLTTLRQLCDRVFPRVRGDG
jgi:hypothetical protein